MSKRDRRLLVKAARLYYDDGMDQNAIGEKLGLSKSGVSRVLRAAEDEGIVQIHVVDEALALGLVERAGEPAPTTAHDPAAVPCPQCGFPVPTHP